MRELTAGVVRSKQIEKMAIDAAARIQKEGMKVRLEAAANALKGEALAAEAAFVLAAVMAFADEEVADEENDVLNEFADLLGLGEERANALLDELAAHQEA